MPALRVPQIARVRSRDCDTFDHPRAIRWLVGAAATRAWAVRVFVWTQRHFLNRVASNSRRVFGNDGRTTLHLHYHTRNGLPKQLNKQTFYFHFLYSKCHISAPVSYESKSNCMAYLLSHVPAALFKASRL